MGLTIEGSAMAAGIGGCLLLSGLFFYLATRSRRRSARWRGAVRLPAVVTSLEYQEARRGQGEINDHRSSTQVTLCFVDQGRRYQRQRQYPGIVLTPQLGQKVPILFQRDSGDWILRSEARTRWPLFLALGGGSSPPAWPCCWTGRGSWPAWPPTMWILQTWPAAWSAP